MRARRIVVAVVALVVALAPVAVMAKGPVAATIVAEDGSRVFLDSHSADGRTTFADLVDAVDALSAIYRTDPHTLVNAPAGHLGPRFEIHWDLGFRNRGEPPHLVRQDAYPDAVGGPITFVPAGQRLYGDDTTRGGWFPASPHLIDLIESLDLAPVRPVGGDAFVGADSGLVRVIVVAVGLAAGLAALTRQRTPSAAR